MTENQWWQAEENDSVGTSPNLWRPLSDAMSGFDLDPAAGCEPTPIADERYTPDDDGLSQPWYGTVWLNPPFSEKTPWYRRLVGQYIHGDVEAAVAVAPVETSAQWFHRWFATADEIGYLDSRDWYLAGDSPSFSTMIGIWNPTDAATDWLSNNGTVVYPQQPDQQTLAEVYDA